jgi:type VI secretion system protein ImpA
MTEATTTDQVSYTWMDWEKASLHERSGHRSTAEDITTARYMTGVLLTRAPFYRQQVTDLEVLLNAAEAYEVVLDKRCGQPTSALYLFRDVVTKMRDFAKKALSQKADEAPEVVETAVGADSEEWTDDETDDAVMSSSGPIRNRAEAYQRLAEAAEYLMRKEPHSPVPHLVKRAVVWGNMSFGELITELVQDHGDIKSIYALLGMQAPGE